MAVSAYTALTAAAEAPHQRITATRSRSGTTTSGPWMSGWALGGGSAPATSRTCDGSLAGALGNFVAPGSGKLYLAGGRYVSTLGGILIADRLVDTTGLVGNVSTAQTTNLPTPALPSRATGGAGVWAAIEAFTAAGWTTDSVSMTVSYTNQAGTSGRTGTCWGRIQNNVRTTGCFWPVLMQDGDTGVRSVESFTLNTASSAAGVMGVVLFRPWALIGLDADGQRGAFDPILDLGMIPALSADECLFNIDFVNGFSDGASNVSGPSYTKQIDMRFVRA